jgi:hypothetical protein
MKRLSVDVEERVAKVQNEIKIKHLILDCSCINNIDSQGVLAFLQVMIDFLRLI